MACGALPYERPARKGAVIGLSTGLVESACTPAAFENSCVHPNPATREPLQGLTDHGPEVAAGLRRVPCMHAESLHGAYG